MKTTIAAAAAALALLAAGCGEKEEPATTGPVVTQTTTAAGTTTTTTGSGKTDEELIRSTVTDFLTLPNDPSVCDELMTPEFLKNAYGDRQGCLASREPGALADRVTILARKPGPGGTTMITVKVQGGVFDGETVKIAVVKKGDAWQITNIYSNAKVGP